MDKSWCGNIVGYSATIWNDVGECAVGAMGMPSCGLQSFLNYISLVMFFSKFNLKPHYIIDKSVTLLYKISFKTNLLDEYFKL